MMGLKRLWGPNKLVRQKMSSANAGFSAVANQVREAQYKYLLGPRSPSILKPLVLESATADWIRERYKSAPKTLSLDWIKRARDDHDLVICPMCGGTTVATLEHVLPKAEYPEFAVLSFNLVPCCDGCQRRRSAKGRHIEVIHPYFDQALLTALRLVVHFIPPYEAVLFDVKAQGVTGQDLLRVQLHLKESLPPHLLRRHLRNLWTKLHKKCHDKTSGETRQRLYDDLKVAETDAPNSWDAAFLRGLIQDPEPLNWMMQTQPR